LEKIPLVLVDPVKCKKIICEYTTTNKTKGNKKCKEKKKFKVELLTENPPHTQQTIFIPIIGIVERKFVITVAPHKDICPQGRT
jgi:hypothetical protein